MKPIIATLEPGTNYVFHMIAIARAGFENEYSDAYADSVNPSDLSLLAEHRKALSWLDGGLGDVAGVFVFELACANPATVEELREFFGLLQDGYERKDLSGYFARYHANDSDDPFAQRDEPYLLSLAAHKEDIDKIAQAYIRNFGLFLEKVWPVESAKMAPAAEELTAHFSKKDVIGKWEETTGEVWRRPNYEIRLCAALDKGPQANSLAYDVNTFYYGRDEGARGWNKDFISHETGTHILMDIYKKVMESRAYDGWLVYRAFENLARFYNFTVLGKEKLYGMGQHYSVTEFEGIYRDLSAKQPGIRPKDLLVAGIEGFLAAGYR